MDFSESALEKFLQLAPQLGNSIISFKDMKDELPENSDLNVGAFILRAGNGYAFVPVIAKGSTIFPIDSVFVKKFLPLTQDVIEEISRLQKDSLGKSTKIAPTVTQNPSVQQFVNPPRTGKFAYASGGRLLDFLASLPNHSKNYLSNAIPQDNTLASALHKLFGLREILTALKPEIDMPVSIHEPAKVITGGENLPATVVNEILTQGYSVVGNPQYTRTAVLVQDGTAEDGITTINPSDENQLYKVYTTDGRHAVGYTFKRHHQHSSRHPVILFDDSTWASPSSPAVAKKIAGDPKKFLKTVFSSNPPMMLRDVCPGTTFALLEPDMTLRGIYTSRMTSITNDSVTVTCKDVNSYQSVRITGLRSKTTQDSQVGSEIFVPINSYVLPLFGRIDDCLETSPIFVSRKEEARRNQVLTDHMRIGYDGYEYQVNGSPIGSEANLVKRLIEGENLSPVSVRIFIKQAKAHGNAQIQLSKKADVSEPFPTFGEKPEDQINPWGTENLAEAVNKTKKVTSLQDKSIVEATLISELIQDPSMETTITEYLPDIEEAVDKLGRALFLLRLNIGKSTNESSSDMIAKSITNIRNTYRMLGDTYLKLKSLV